jgi:hypothetical protein
VRLENPEAVLTRTDLRDLGYERRAVDAIFRACPPSPNLFALVQDLCPRDDRIPERPVFTGLTGDRLRTRLRSRCDCRRHPCVLAA